MAFPKPVPSLSKEEFAQFVGKMDEFEIPEEMEEDLEKHIEAIEKEKAPTAEEIAETTGADLETLKKAGKTVRFVERGD